MTGWEYQKKAIRTAGTNNEKDLLVNGVMGLNGEAGECIDHVKKHLFQGHDLNRVHMIEELGDVMWYVAITCHALGASLDEVMDRNVEKLIRRYPDGFDAERSLHREERE